MFINKDRPRELSSEPVSPSLAGFFREQRGLKIAIISFTALLLLAGFVVVFMVLNRQEAEAPTVIDKPVVVQPLPSSEILDVSSLLDDGELGLIKAEDLIFGDYYRSSPSQVEVQNPGVAVPMNVKREADNYYDFTRYIDLDEVIEDINANGFAVIDNPFHKEADDFYGVYELLQEKKLPLLLTSDFLIYYYQNSLKNMYKEIEANVFYQTFWEINKEMFMIADKRYRDRLTKVGLLNDPLLEAQRLEAAYFATALTLLSPQPHQVLDETEKDYIDPIKFTTLEAEKYSFTPPSYLKQDVDQEVELIMAAKDLREPVKSPALRYYRFYKEFKIPYEYNKKAKLYNFYLASKWSNSVFPLYFDGDDCPQCLLDRDDWEVNFIAANLVAQDFEANQDLKNEWAKIYKTVGYFSSLRSGLVYIDYRNALHKLFGETAILEDVLAVNNPERDNNLVRLYNEIKSKQFDVANGGYDPQDLLKQPEQGMRLLQENYWPDDYIFSQLLFSPIGDYNDYNSKINDHDMKSMCLLSHQKTMRCRGNIYDIVKVVYPYHVTDPYIAKNSDYQFYEQEMEKLRQHFSTFTDTNWHNTNFWSMVELSRIMLEDREVSNLGYTGTEAWVNQIFQTSAGSIFNSQMPVDTWVPSYRREASLQSEDVVVKYNFVEPQLSLVNELLADSYMLFKTMYRLDLVKENDTEFGELINNLITIKRLISKQLVDQEFNFDDWRFLSEFVTKYYIEETSEKIVKSEFIDPETDKPYHLQRSLEGVKLLMSVQFYQNRQIIVVGPVFNYQEKKK